MPLVQSGSVGTRLRKLNSAQKRQVNDEHDQRSGSSAQATAQGVGNSCAQADGIDLRSAADRRRQAEHCVGRPRRTAEGRIEGLVRGEMLTLDFHGGAAPPDATVGREVHVWRDDCGQVFATGRVSGGTRWIEWPGLGTFSRSDHDTTVRGWPASDVSSDVFIKTFERIVQPLLLQGLGYQTLHAGAVAGRSGALAFCGTRGAGKSTIGFGLRARGWTQMADDALVVSAMSGRIVAHPLPFTPRLRESSFEHFAGPSNQLPSSAAGVGRRPVPLSAIFLLRQTSDASAPVHAERLSGVRAFLALLPHAHNFDETSREAARTLSEDYLTVAEKVPAFALTYRSDLKLLPELLTAIEELAANRRAGSRAEVLT